MSAAPNLSGAGAAKVPGAFAGAGRKKLPDLLGWLAALLAVLALFLLPAAVLCGWWWPDSWIPYGEKRTTLAGLCRPSRLSRAVRRRNQEWERRSYRRLARRRRRERPGCISAGTG